MHRRFALVTAIAVLAFAARPSRAWAPDTQRAIAHEAVRLAPPDLYRLIVRHLGELDAGVVEPFGEKDPFRHMKNDDGSGTLDRVVFAESDAAIAAIRAHRPFAEIVRRLGRVSHFVADANNPLNTSARDPEEPRFFRDYLLYVESARPRFAVVFYGLPALASDRRSLEAALARTFARGRELYALIGIDYRRVNFAPGQEAFDDKSTAFGAAALAFSHAVTDVAAFLRYVWLSGGGADPRRADVLAGQKLLVITEGGAG